MFENTDSIEHVKPQGHSSQWHLLGAGALGCLFAAHLYRTGIPLELIVRNDATLQQLHANGGITLLRSMEEHTRNDATHTIAIAASTIDSVQAPIKQLLICTKAQQTLAAVTAIKSKIAPDALIVLLQNGMGVRERLQREFPCAIILNALSTEGAFRSERFQIAHAGRGETIIGATDPQQHAFAQTIVQSLQCELPITFAADIEQRLWLKLAVNSVINPLTALHRCRNGELLQRENIEAEVAQLCDELAQITRAENIDLNTEKLHAEVYRVMQATAHNKSSMLQDVEAGRATEIDFINGFIVQRARAHNLPCPHHEHLLATIHALEAHRPAP